MLYIHLKTGEVISSGSVFFFNDSIRWEIPHDGKDHKAEAKIDEVQMITSTKPV